MWVGVAFDACLLADIELGDDAEVFERIQVITQIRKAMAMGTVKMLLDTQRHILGEYYRLLPRASIARRFVTLAIATSAISYETSTPSNHCSKMLAQDGFDNDDWPYVGVAQAVCGIYATTEQKHLRPQRRHCVQEHCEVTIVELIELPSLLKVL